MLARRIRGQGIQCGQHPNQPTYISDFDLGSDKTLRPLRCLACQRTGSRCDLESVDIRYIVNGGKRTLVPFRSSVSDKPLGSSGLSMTHPAPPQSSIIDKSAKDRITHASSSQPPASGASTFMTPVPTPSKHSQPTPTTLPEVIGRKDTDDEDVAVPNQPKDRNQRSGHGVAGFIDPRATSTTRQDYSSPVTLKPSMGAKGAHGSDADEAPMVITIIDTEDESSSGFGSDSASVQYATPRGAPAPRQAREAPEIPKSTSSHPPPIYFPLPNVELPPQNVRKIPSVHPPRDFVFCGHPREMPDIPVYEETTLSLPDDSELAGPGEVAHKQDLLFVQQLRQDLNQWAAQKNATRRLDHWLETRRREQALERETTTRSDAWTMAERTVQPLLDHLLSHITQLEERLHTATARNTVCHCDTSSLMERLAAFMAVHPFQPEFTFPSVLAEPEGTEDTAISSTSSAEGTAFTLLHHVFGPQAQTMHEGQSDDELDDGSYKPATEEAKGPLPNAEPGMTDLIRSVKSRIRRGRECDKESPEETDVGPSRRDKGKRRRVADSETPEPSRRRKGKTPEAAMVTRSSGQAEGSRRG